MHGPVVEVVAGEGARAVVVRGRGGALRLVLSGDLSTAATRRVRVTLQDLAGAGSPVEVDLSRVTHLGVEALRALLALAHTLGTHHASLQVTRTCAAVDRTVAMAGVRLPVALPAGRRDTASAAPA